jgi:hypothetical protein
MDNLITLSVGDEYHLRSGKDNIVYAGMPSDKVYSIVQRKRKFAPYAAWGYAWNLFFPKEQSNIRIDGVRTLPRTKLDCEYDGYSAYAWWDFTSLCQNTTLSYLQTSHYEYNVLPYELTPICLTA